MTDSTEQQPEHIPEQVRIDANNWFLRLESDDLNEAEEEAFVLWLNESHLHQIALADAESLWQEMGQLEIGAATNLNESSTHASPITAAKAKSSQRPSIKRWAQGFAIAASILLAVLLGDDALLSLQADYITSVGESRVVSLDDGSQVKLNTDSAIKIHFDESQRRIELLQGEAHFQVAKDQRRAFVVLSNDIKTTALGTGFNIRLTPKGAEVTVTEHSVSVAAEKDSETSIEVSKGQQVIASKKQLGKVQEADLRLANAWQNQRLIFKGKPLAEVIAELNRYHRGHILILDNDIANLQVTGVFNTKDPLAALDIIEQNLSLKKLEINAFLIMLRKG